MAVVGERTSVVSLEDLRAHESATRVLCAALDPESIPLPAAPAAFATLARMEKLVSGAKVRLARRVEESKVAERSGARDTAEYLARQSGTSIGSARDALDTSKRMRFQPTVEEAVRQGELSGPQAAAIADAVAVNPAAEARLVDTARQASLGELRSECGRAKAEADPDPEATHRRIHAGRFLRRGTDAEGAWTIHGRGTVDAGAEVNAALEPIIDELFTAARREGRKEPREAYAFDALVELARRLAGASGEAATPARRRAERHLTLVRVDLEALLRGATEGDEYCEITGLGPIPVSVARRLLGDSVLKLVITRGVDVAHVTHLGRGPSAAQLIALLWSRPGCGVLGCPRIARIENDHRVPYEDCKVTELINMDRACEHHHDLKTYKGWAFVAGTGKRPMVPPEDPRHPANQANAPPAGPGPPEGGEDSSEATTDPTLFGPGAD